MPGVPELYDQDPEGEWLRLVKSPYRSLEFSLTMRCLRKHLPARGKVLDAGGGPGRYSIELARQRYEVTLLDVSSGVLEAAKVKFESEEAATQGKMAAFVLADIRDLSVFQDGSFDVVLCLGSPLSYVDGLGERHKAVFELARVAKPGGIVAISVVGYLAMLRTVLVRVSSQLLDLGRLELMAHGDDLVRGVKMHFFHAEELRTLAEECDLKTLEMVGLQGLSTGLPEATNQAAEDPKVWEAWFRLVEQTASEPAVVDMGEHMLYVGRKARRRARSRARIQAVKP
jgi:ubiquinone/menaquinone biosynthesis C-methylase UbiE